MKLSHMKDMYTSRTQLMSSHFLTCYITSSTTFYRYFHLHPTSLWLQLHELTEKVFLITSPCFDSIDFFIVPSSTLTVSSRLGALIYSYKELASFHFFLLCHLPSLSSALVDLEGVKNKKENPKWSKVVVRVDGWWLVK